MKRTGILIILAVLFIMAINTVSAAEWPVTAEVVIENGNTVMKVDGEVVIPMSYFGYGDYEQYYKFYNSLQYSSAAGCEIYVLSLPCDASSESQMEIFDESVRQLVEIDPDAYVIARISAFATEWGYPAMPDSETAKKYDGTNLAWMSMSSPAWYDRIEENYTRYIERIAQNEDVASHVIGFFPVNAINGEWVHVGFESDNNMADYSEVNQNAFREWVKAKYKKESALKAAWDDNSVTFDTVSIPTPEERLQTNDGIYIDITKGSAKVVDYNEFYNETFANAIAHCGKVIKEATGGKVLVEALYGYFFAYAPTKYPVATGAYALGKLLESPYIDILSSPYSYNDRLLGKTKISLSIVESVMANGKMWLYEDDTRTHLVPKGSAEQDLYRFDTLEETLSAVRRNFGYTTVRGAGFYYMDMAGTGWYSDVEIWNNFANERSIFAATQYTKSKGGYNPELAMIVDEESYYFSEMRNNYTYPITKLQHQEVVESGISYGVYYKSDLDKLPESVKIIILTNAFYMDNEDRAALEKFKNGGRVIIFMGGTGYIDEDGNDVNNIIELSGINLTRLESVNSGVTAITNTSHPILDGLEDSVYGTPAEISPAFVISDADVTVLGNFKNTLYTSFGYKDMGEWISVYSGSAVMKAQIISRFATEYANAHAYKSIYNVTDGVETDGRLITYTPGLAGQKTVFLPYMGHIVDVINHKNMGDYTSFVRFNAAYKGETHMFISAPGMLEKKLLGVNGDGIHLENVGDSITYTFNNTYLSVFADMGPDKGRIGITLDGREYPFIDLCSESEKKNCEFPIAVDLPMGEHKITLTLISSPVYTKPTVDLTDTDPDYNTIIVEKPMNVRFGNPNYKVNMGVKFSTKIPGKITKARIYTNKDGKGDYVVALWNVATGKMAAGPYRWNLESPKTGWNYYTFSEPIAIEAENEYIIAVCNVSGTNHFASVGQYFKNYKANSSVFMIHENSGVFITSENSMPVNGFDNTCYLSDVVFTYDKSLKEESTQEGNENTKRSVTLTALGHLYPYEDINFDQNIDVLDVITLKGYVIGKIDLTETLAEKSDFNGDGEINEKDVFELINLIYKQ